MKVVGNVERNLLVRGFFKTSIECDEFDKIRQKKFRASGQNWQAMIDETLNRAWEWNLLIDVNIFHVNNFFIRGIFI